MARRRVSGRRQLPNRKFIWAREHMSVIVPAEDAAFINLLEEFTTEYGARLVGATVMRLRGRLEFEPSVASTTTSAAGVRIMNRATLEKIEGAQQIDGPFTDQHADWMAYEPLLYNDNDPTRQVPRWDVDVKAARKMEELGDTLVLVVENTIVGATVTVRGTISVGLKLP